MLSFPIDGRDALPEGVPRQLGDAVLCPQVTGEAWFDHQWGDFVFMGGGWDWFAIELSDGRSIMLSLVRGAADDPLLVYGTVLSGHSIDLSSRDFRVQVQGRWKSPRTGADYPAGWRLTIPRIGLAFDLKPTVADQELDTRASSGGVYWEGSQKATVSRIGADGSPRTGETPSAEAYVELTGYAPQSPAERRPARSPDGAPPGARARPIDGA